MNVLYSFNVSQMRKPYTHAIWDEWKHDLLPRVHDEADQHPGFVASDHGEHYACGYIRPYVSLPLIMGNMSQWRSERDLFNFTFNGSHRELMLRRMEWFHPWPDRHHALVMWWAPPGKFDIQTARTKLLHLQRNGPSADAFGWSKKK